jgi:hypothetical protein
MAVPRFAQTPPIDDARGYESPPVVPDSWMPDRPAEIIGFQPEGPRLGHQGPDQGYALVLARRMQHRILLQPDESLDDAIHGCVPIALRRASLMGRAPVVHDLVVAFTVWGFLDEQPPEELVEIRKSLFAEIAHAGHSSEREKLVAMVPESTLRLTPEAVKLPYAIDWKSLLDLPERLRTHDG